MEIPGPIVLLTVTDLMYVPLAGDGRFRLIASIGASKFSVRLPDSKLT